uniref:NADH dehydrogenase subunit 6 n=1 Tax=Grandidierella taihuensis TaxID=2778875 RepID=UPI001BF0B78C|nr:NADH dehydrogenase subunit 6 [Grandidierella taihuensis]QTX95228.1 NADH dehydrogenase subunit 6 [Grandidierella taihuensis]
MFYIASQLSILVFLIFLFSEHLLVMNFSLILASIIFSFVMYNQLMTTWLSYLLIMVFLSGLMVLFIYMTSLSSNEPFYFSYFSLVVLGVVNFFWPLVGLMSKGFSLMPLVSSLKNYSSGFILDLVNKTYSTLSMDLTVVMIIYLFVTLVVTVKISSLSSVPLKRSL